MTTAAAAQTPPAPPQLRAVNRTVYTRTTELFAEWRPLIVGQATRLTAHLTHTGDHFRPYTEGKVTLALTVEDRVEVTSGLRAGERIVVRGAEKMPRQ